MSIFLACTYKCLVLLVNCFAASMEFEDAANWTCVVHYRVSGVSQFSIKDVPPPWRSRAVLVIKTQQCCTIFCVVHCRVRRKSIFDQRRATPVEMCQEILLDSTVSTDQQQIMWQKLFGKEDCVTLVGALAP